MSGKDEMTDWRKGFVRNLTSDAIEDLDPDHPYERVSSRGAAIEALKILIKYIDTVKLRPYRQRLDDEIRRIRLRAAEDSIVSPIEGIKADDKHLDNEKTCKMDEEKGTLA